MNEIVYVALVTIENGETWMFKETPQGWRPYYRVRQLIDMQPVSAELSNEVIVS